MLLAMDPTATWEFVLPGQDGMADPVRLVCRYLSVRGALRFREARAKLLDGVRSDTEIPGRIEEALAGVVVEVRGLPPGMEGVPGLLEVATLPQLLDWMGEIALKQTVSERERKNSESRQPGSPEPSAASAGAAGA